MLKRAPSYRTLELELLEWQERELFEYFVVVSLKKKPSRNTYLPEVSYQFPKVSVPSPDVPPPLPRSCALSLPFLSSSLLTFDPSPHLIPSYTHILTPCPTSLPLLTLPCLLRPSYISYLLVPAHVHRPSYTSSLPSRDTSVHLSPLHTPQIASDFAACPQTFLLLTSLHTWFCVLMPG